MRLKREPRPGHKGELISATLATQTEPLAPEVQEEIDRIKPVLVSFYEKYAMHAFGDERLPLGRVIRHQPSPDGHSIPLYEGYSMVDEVVDARIYELGLEGVQRLVFDASEANRDLWEEEAERFAATYLEFAKHRGINNN